MGGPPVLTRRQLLAAALGGGAGLALPACGEPPEPGRYTEVDVAGLARQREDESARSGRGPFGAQRYRGYRGLAELPWFELDPEGRLRCVADDLPPAIDIHCHLGMSLLLPPDVDLQASTPRVRHLLDCDAWGPERELDLDVYTLKSFVMSYARLETRSVYHAHFGNRSSSIIPRAIFDSDFIQQRYAFSCVLRTSPRGVIDVEASNDLYEIDRHITVDHLKSYGKMQRLFGEVEDCIAIWDGGRWGYYLHAGGVIYGVLLSLRHGRDRRPGGHAGLRSAVRAS